MKPYALLIAGLMPLFQASGIPTDQPYGYKNFVVGVTTYQDWTAKLSPKQAKLFARITPCSQPKDGIRFCNVTGTSVDGAFGSFVFLDDRLAVLDTVAGIDAPLKGYIDVLTGKYGDPFITTESFQNGYGASRTGRIWKWMNAVSAVDLEEFAPGSFNSSIGTYSRLRYRDLKLADELLKRTETKPTL